MDVVVSRRLWKNWRLKDPVYKTAPGLLYDLEIQQ
jgi:hypothetical protein